MFVVFCCRSEIYYFEVCVLWVKVLFHSSVVFANLEIILLKQDVLWFQVCMSVPNAVDKTKGSEDLVEEFFHQSSRKSFVLVLFYQLV